MIAQQTDNAQDLDARELDADNPNARPQLAPNLDPNARPRLDRGREFPINIPLVTAERAAGHGTARGRARVAGPLGERLGSGPAHQAPGPKHRACPYYAGPDNTDIPCLSGQDASGAGQPDRPMSRDMAALLQASAAPQDLPPVTCVEELLEVMDGGCSIKHIFGRMRGLKPSRIRRMMDSRKFREHMDLRRRLAHEMTTTAAAVASPEAVEELRRLYLCDKPETVRKSCMALVRLGRAGRKAGETGDRDAGDRETVGRAEFAPAGRILRAGRLHTMQVVLSPIDVDRASWSAVEGADVETSTCLCSSHGQHPEKGRQEPVSAGSRPFRLVPPGSGTDCDDSSNFNCQQDLQHSTHEESQTGKVAEDGPAGHGNQMQTTENRTEENSKDRISRSQTTAILNRGTVGMATNSVAMAPETAVTPENAVAPTNAVGPEILLAPGTCHFAEAFRVPGPI